jgi:hypothetical protein
MRCFSPDSTPGVSTSVISSSMRVGSWLPSNLQRAGRRAGEWGW